MATVPLTSTAAGQNVVASRVYQKIAWRLMPFLMFCYFSAYLDRVNVGFAKLQMSTDLGFSETVYGLGAGIFFIGYFFFEVPSNLILHRVGARVWIARIMITWAVISAGFAFVETATQFYVLRFLLGVAEAGFSPGILLYLSYWFPAARRGKATAMYFIAIPLSGVIGGPLSGWIMGSMGAHPPFAGWQWLFLLEAIPALMLSVATLFFLDDSVAKAKWLSPAERELVAKDLEADNHGKQEHHSIRGFLADKRVWTLAMAYFANVMGIYALAFWVPSMIKASGVADTFQIGLYSAIPFAVAIAAIIASGISADRTRWRRLHFGAAMLLGALGLLLTATPFKSTGFAVFFLSLAAAGILSGTSLFWSIPATLLGGVTAAAGIAFINCVGNLAGFVSPYLVGWLNDQTHRADAGMLAISGFLIAGALLIACIPGRLVNK
ncbi:MFS transporter [Pseudomonas sp. NPDC007930]|uniref:MFS transporter n=1 Tax=Pseudomonas sp. NPDC007930 TaxID=3364417 RepID=UPI0036EFFCFF